jgi:hypothetical protein
MRYLQKTFCSRLIISIAVLFIFNGVYAQCPVIDSRNNGNGQSTDCYEVWDNPNRPPTFTFKTGDFKFSTVGTSLRTLRVLRNGLVIQEGNQLLNGNTNVWFGGFNGDANKQRLCFYGTENNSPIPPAANYTFYFENASTGAALSPCSYIVTTSNGVAGVSNFLPGTISADQTICSSSSPSTIVGTTTSNCTGTVTYQWQASTLTSTDGYLNAPGSSTSQSYSPGTLTQTTYFQRLATCSSDGVTANSNVITITVNSAGTISPSAGYTWNAQTVSPTFSVTGATSGVGTWTSSNPSVATIGSSSGVVTAVTGGTSIITYSLFAGGITCTTTRSITITDNNGVLPVTWKSVSAEKLSDRVLVRWSTAAELNTRDFEVQFSTNAADWQPIGRVAAAGKSESPRDYSLLHQSPQKGGVNNFYRILQRDLDGAFSYSKIVSIIMDAPGPDVMIFPNPASNLLTVYIAESQKLRLINSSGATVWQAALSAGRHQIAVSHYQKGVYFLMTNNGPQKVVIQ